MNWFTFVIFGFSFVMYCITPIYGNVSLSQNEIKILKSLLGRIQNEIHREAEGEGESADVTSSKVSPRYTVAEEEEGPKDVDMKESSGIANSDAIHQYVEAEAEVAPSADNAEAKVAVAENRGGEQDAGVRESDSVLPKKPIPQYAETEVATSADNVDAEVAVAGNREWQQEAGVRESNSNLSTRYAEAKAEVATSADNADAEVAVAGKRGGLQDVDMKESSSVLPKKPTTRYAEAEVAPSTDNVDAEVAVAGNREWQQEAGVNDSNRVVNPDASTRYAEAEAEVAPSADSANAEVAVAKNIGGQQEASRVLPKNSTTQYVETELEVAPSADNADVEVAVAGNREWQQEAGVKDSNRVANPDASLRYGKTESEVAPSADNADAEVAGSRGGQQEAGVRESDRVPPKKPTTRYVEAEAEVAPSADNAEAEVAVAENRVGPQEAGVKDSNFDLIMQANEEIQDAIENRKEVLSKQPAWDQDLVFMVLKVITLSKYWQDVINDLKLCDEFESILSNDDYYKFEQELRSEVDLLKALDCLTNREKHAFSAIQAMPNAQEVSEDSIREILKEAFAPLTEYAPDSTKRLIANFIEQASKFKFGTEPKIPSYALFGILECIKNSLTKQLETLDKFRNPFFRNLERLEGTIASFINEINKAKSSGKTPQNTFIYLECFAECFEKLRNLTQNAQKDFKEHIGEISILSKTVVDRLQNLLNAKKNPKIFDYVRRN